MTDKIIDIVVLIALPASGKSEVRKYLRSVPAAKCAEEFHLGPNVQFDDFPYVHMMRQIDTKLTEANKPSVFFSNNDKPFLDARDWGTLVELVNEDYSDIVTKKELNPSSAAHYLFERIDAAGEKVGIPARLSALDESVRNDIAVKLEEESLDLLKNKRELQTESLEGKTVVIEFARGGPDGSAMPLSGGYGYQYSLPLLSDEILEKAALFYIWVTPEESRHKNDNRADPNNPGSILHHGVPLDVMLNDYGCDDVAWLEEHSERPGTITVKAHGKTFYLPFARFDNRVDKTDFIRNDQASWKPEQVASIHGSLKEAFDKLV